MDKEAYIKWYILAENTIKNNLLIPKRTNKEILSLVSRKSWLLFAKDGKNKDDVINGKEPNAYFYFSRKKGNLTGEAVLGLTFNNLKSYEKFKTIMHGYNKEIKKLVIDKLLKLENHWKIEISSKIKDHHRAEPPRYLLSKEWESNKIDDTIIDDIVKIANNIREQGVSTRDERRANGRFYRETPSINLMVSEFKLTDDEFKKRILEIFEVLSICLNIKTNIEIKKIKNEKQKQLLQKEKEIEKKKKYKKELEFLKSIGKDTQEKIDKIQEEIAGLEEEKKIIEKILR